MQWSLHCVGAILLALLSGWPTLAELFYCYNPVVRRGVMAGPQCDHPRLKWISGVQLCCGNTVISGRNAVNIFNRVRISASAETHDNRSGIVVSAPGSHELEEIALPPGCKKGVFLANLNRRFCPLWMTNIKLLDICCRLIPLRSDEIQANALRASHA